MTTLVAGAAGFIGSHLCDRLLAEGRDVVGIDNLVTGRIENLAGALAQPRFRFVEHDITTALPDVGAVDEIFHLASPASPTDFATIPLEILEVGSTGTKHLLQLAERLHARFLLASTSEIYGDPLVHPQPETYLGNVDSIGPRSCYDEAKRFAEAITSAYRRHRGVDTVIIRIFNTYGPRMRPDDGRVLTNFITQALRGEPVTLFGDGSQTRSFCYVDDEVGGIIAALRSGVAGPINIGNPAEITMREVAELVVELVGSSSEIVTRPLPAEREGDPVRRRPDITRARDLLRWAPTVPLREGLTSMIADTRRALGHTG
jgi:dTDP-glucose 4,6-dehydratase